MTTSGWDTYERGPAAYHAVRPKYPPEVFATIERYAPNLPSSPRTLEIGAGTGQASGQMAARGWRVLALEPGNDLAETARTELRDHDDVDVRAVRFEAAELPDGDFDLVTAATAWHWVDPEIGYSKAARLLKPGGAMALWWNAHLTDTLDPRWAPIRRVYENVAPQLAQLAPLTPDRPDYDPAAELAESGFFTRVEQQRFPFAVTYTTTEFLTLIGTYASHRTLTAPVRRRLHSELANAIDSQLSGMVTKPYDCLLVLGTPVASDGWMAPHRRRRMSVALKDSRTPSNGSLALARHESRQFPHVRHGAPMNQQQFEKIKSDDGFIAALDQSGGSTPKALHLYGIEPDAYSGDEEMFSLIHEARTRMITSPSFDGDRVLGAILFEDTMDRQIEGRDTPDYLWQVKNIVPFLKVDKGLANEADGAQIMKPMPDLNALLHRARDKGVFGTKMRSVIQSANGAGVNAVVDQQFEVGRQILAAGLVPIIEPEIDIHSPDKAETETLLRSALLAQLDRLANDEQVMLKLTLPETDNFYSDLVGHPKVLRVVALSGGYSREEANARLSRNNGVVASFSRALAEGLSAQQSEEEFDAELDSTIASIFEASRT